MEKNTTLSEQLKNVECFTVATMSWLTGMENLCPE